MKNKSFAKIAFFVMAGFLTACHHEGKQISLTLRSDGWKVDATQWVYKPGEYITITLSPHHQGDQIVLKNISQKGEPILAQSEEKLSWSIEKNDSNATYSIGIFVERTMHEPEYVTCIRVASDSILTTYRIDKENFNGLNVYKLDGGMSAEYAVEKSLSNLTGNISQTWNIGPGGGPSPVWSTSDFLEKSLQYTIQLYDRELGKDKELETIIISTGIPVTPYLSAALKAPVLPLHFLVSANSCREIQSILNYASQKGYSSYATLGYDASMAGVGVAWIKLLDIPDEYTDFISRHRVKNVILAGVGENVLGESYARRILPSPGIGRYTPGSIYLQYTNHGSQQDMRTITANIVDYEIQKLDTVCMIADWESGILDQQIKSFGKKLNQIHIDCYALTTPNNMINLYNLATNIALEYIKKNESLIKGPSQITFNEYLISEPMYELACGHIPLLYWQFVPPALTVQRLNDYTVRAINRVFPLTQVKKMKIHLNARVGKYELAQELKENQYSHVTMRADHIEEIWNLTDGLNAPCEMIAYDITNHIGVSTYQANINQLQPLSINDITRLSNQVQGIQFKRVH